MNPFDEFLSHPKKPLRVHIDGVRSKASRNTALNIADVATLFHDLGKLNPNFQLKVKGKKPEGFDSHSYLSTLAFLSFLLEGDNAAQLGITKFDDIVAVVSLISHHHGHLHDLKELLSKDQIEKLEQFIQSQPLLPVSEYFTQWREHHAFDISSPKALKCMKAFIGVADKQLDLISDKLAFFLDTQFAFACLIEADKRDAGYNEVYLRQEQLNEAKTKFRPPLESKLASLKTSGVTREPPKTLNQVRTFLLKQATENLKTSLQGGNRIFSLTAPTGAGKTLMLLALANEIRKAKGDYSLIYGLPFLSITEQVENVCKEEIWTDWKDLITRQDSRTRRPDIERLIEEADENPEATDELLKMAFSNETFDSAFTLTTFVQIFETLLANRNATLLKLPNFSKSIFLLDEIQALPPRLYVFFAAYLHEFCERFDCYVVISTATMPALSLPNSDLRNFFPRYPTEIPELLGESAFTFDVFNRYIIHPVQEDWTRESLAESIASKDESALVILNTIDDSLEVYKLVTHLLKQRGDQTTQVLLLNTRFILSDRKEKIRQCKKILKEKNRVVLISTQMIEAGVDVDFPNVYRDWCSLPSLIQASGRCNRNGKFPTGHVYFGRLVVEGKPRAPLVYRDPADVWFLAFAREKITKDTSEKALLAIQKEFFQEINENLEVGRANLWANGKRQKDNLIHRIKNGDFALVGSFQLIDKDTFGEEFRYYIPESDDDQKWNDLDQACFDQWKAKKAAEKAGRKWTYADSKSWDLKIETLLRGLSERVVTIRCSIKAAPAPYRRDNGEIVELLGIRRLLHRDSYSGHHGLMPDDGGAVIL